MDILFHICPWEEWKRAKRQRRYEPESLAVEGFIHAATAADIKKIAKLFFGNRANLVILLIDRELIASLVKEEVAKHQRLRGKTFPHIYGPIPIKAVVDVIPIAAFGLFDC